MEYFFTERDIDLHEHTHTDPRKAFNEAIWGDHVAHCTTSNGHRSVAIRTSVTPPGRFNIDMSGQGGNIRESWYGLTKRQAVTLVDIFLNGIPVHPDRPGYVEFINQADRDVSILVETITPSRVRIEYELPNTGATRAWRRATKIAGWIFILPGAM